MDHLVLNYLTEENVNSLLKLLLVIGLCLTVLILTQVSFGEIESPRKQLKHGIALEKIACNQNKVLVQRPSGIPACVSPSSAERLANHGWKTIVNFEKDKVQIKDLTKSIEIPKKNTGNVNVVPASGGSVIDFYIRDDDLNLAHGGVETVSTEGLIEFTISGVVIKGPSSMIETGPDTGEFNLKLQLPNTINGRPINQDDIVVMKYFDQSDASGDKQTLEKSVSLSKSYAQVQTTDDKKRIGHEFVLRIYEPDANLDSRDVDRISLSRLKYEGEGGIKTTLSNPDFDANSNYLLETGENTNIFEVVIKIPRTLDGKTVQIGDWFEIKYVDISTPSNTVEDVIYRGKIGLAN
jgi:hypothetical protein